MPALRRTRQRRRNFDPQDLPGLILWLRPELLHGFADQGLVHLWMDSSGRGNHGTTSAQHPLAELRIWGRGGAMSLGFNGAHKLDLPNITQASPTSGFFAVTGTGSAGYRGILVAHAIGWYHSLTTSSWGMYFNLDVSSSGQIVATPSPWVLATVARANNDVDLATNGGSLVTRTNAASVQARGATRLGADPSGAQFLTGASICEVIWYDRAVTTGERKAIEEYLYRRFVEPPAFPLGTT